MSDIHLVEYLRSQKEWLESFLYEMLSIPSVSGEEGDVQKFIYNTLEDLEINCELISINNDIKDDPEYSYPVKDLDYNNRVNIKAVKGDGRGKVIVINSHVDVVPPSTGQEAAFSPRMDGKGNVYARGACDAKGQIAAMVLLLKAACEYKKLKHDIICHFVIEEEFGGNGTLAMLRNKKDFKPDAMINMEPTNLRLMPSIRGAVWFEMRFTGKSGHAGDVSNTENAIFKAIRAVEILKEYHAKLLEASKDYGLFSGIKNPMPLTIGKFLSGVWPSMVPNESRISGVIGFLPNITRKELINGLKNEFNKDENHWLTEGMELSFPYRHNAVETPTSHWFTQGMSAASKECGIDYLPAAMTASTDAVFYSDKGIPSIVFGPGELKYAHSVEEHIRIDDILKSVEVIFTFIDELDKH